MTRLSLKMRVLLWLVLGWGLLASLFPVYWMLNTSLKQEREIYFRQPTFLPKNFTVKNYFKIFTENDFAVNLSNSVLVTVTVTVLSIGISFLAAYSIARMRPRWGQAVGKMILYFYLIPATLMYIPLYSLVTSMGLNNTLLGLGLVYPTITVPYATWMLLSYLGSIPHALEEAAFMEGCGRIRSMCFIVFPLAIPGVISTAIFSFTLLWSEYLYALVIVAKKKFYTVPLALANLIVDDLYAWGRLMACSLIATIPILLLYNLGTRYMVSGLTEGGVKQ